MSALGKNCNKVLYFMHEGAKFIYLNVLMQHSDELENIQRWVMSVLGKNCNKFLYFMLEGTKFI